MGKTNLRKLLSIALSIVLLSSSFFIDANAIDTLYGIRYDYEESKEFDLNGQPSYKGYINVYGNATIKGENPLKDFNESMDDLHEIIDNPENKVTAATSTQVEFASKEDEAENTLRVEIDFAGSVLSQPLNVMFVMDQSGSLNMHNGPTGLIAAPSPNMNPRHYYKTSATLYYEDKSSEVFEYYHSPQHSKITGAWFLSYTAIEDYASKGGGKYALPGLVDYYVSPDKEIVSNIDIVGDINEYKKIVDVKLARIYSDADIYVLKSDYESDTVFGPTECTFFSSATDLDFPFEKYNSAAYFEEDWMYYSPELFSSTNFYSSNSASSYNDFDSAEYINEMIEQNRAYDRMLLSKILFKDLSSTILENNIGAPEVEHNKIGFVQFAGVVEPEGFRGLSTEEFEDIFTKTRGYYGTNYYRGLTKAQELFEDESRIVDTRHPKNLVIFVSDGAPDPAFTADMMQRFLNSTNAIVYFAGIDLDQTTYNEYLEILATKDTKTGKYLGDNGTDLEGLMKITEDIKSLINAASVMSAKINENFVLRFDADHTIELTYRKAGETESETILIDSLPTSNKEKEVRNAANELIGTLSYDETTQEISWNITHNNVNNARLSFYTKVNEEKVTWDEIATGGSFESIVLDNTDVFYINQDGFADSVEAADLGDILIEGNSQLRIENTSSPATNAIFEVEDGYKTGVLVGSEITYKIKVKNEAIGRIVNAENLSILQKIPDNTTYVGHNYEARIYNKTDDTFKTIDISKAYDEDKNRILFSVDELKVDEWLEFEYRVKVTDEPNEEIVSYAQLGVLGQDNTFNPAEDEPYLQSLYLVHETYAQKPPHTSNPQTSYYLED